jgi:hypothetical protein
MLDWSVWLSLANVLKNQKLKMDSLAYKILWKSVPRGEPMDKNTNFWDFLVILMYLSFLLALLGGTAYLVQVHDWSIWTFLATMLFIPSIKTGMSK